MRLPKVRKRWIVLALLIVAVGWWASIRPSNQRDWAPDNAVLPYAEFAGDSVRVRNVRNASYVTTDSFTVAYDDRAYDLRELESAWYVVEPFSRDWRGPAHTLVSFGFGQGRYLAVSVEIRRERGEIFNPLKGMLRQFEIMYVVADERDVIRLRTNYRRDPVYLYPIRADREKLRAVFVDMMARANSLRERPEFYNTLTSTCTSNLVRHVNRISPRRVPRLSYKVFLPGYSDRLAYDLGLIDTDLPFEQARERYHVNALAERYGSDPAFSERIRQFR